MNVSTRKSRGIFYGWRVAGAGSIALVVTMGCVNGTFPVFFEFLEKSVGWGRGWIAAGFAGYIALAGLCSPFAGMLIDRFGARAVMQGGAVGMAVFLALLSTMQNLTHYILIMIALGTVTTAVTFIPIQKLVATWFVSARGAAMGLAMAGGPLGAAVMPFVARWMMPAIGWRLSYVIYGFVIVLLLTPLVQLVIRNRPGDIGLQPDGATEPAPKEPEAEEGERSGPAQVGLRRMLLSGTFIFFCFVALLTAVGSGAPPMHFFVFARDFGFDETLAAAVVSVYSITSIFGTLLFGWLADKIDKRLTIGIVNLLGAASIGAMLLAGPWWLFFAGVFVFGLCWGAGFSLWPMLLAETFGVRHYAALMGVITVPITLGWAASPILAGIDFDINRNYLFSFGGLAVLLAAAGILIAVVRSSPTADSAEVQST